ncbi:long-chain-fatty-acid--CoA ligase [Paenibacillus methanolicus]|uniref:Long-chain acyl-CoA synthetase n=1 Tax=Paenibacillus methanolicus TaxID=582686 RepID=A0A5S5BWW6_9BACL|nr:long-chain fatty acid--CoA ligase [Paenibacillus methanolicus]TYP70682.1 long-chain acyl-CoA synthetase [Paenibacillus methanolicus]
MEQEREKERLWYRHYPVEVPPAVDIPDDAVHELLIRAAEKYPHHDALDFFGKRTTYAKLCADARRIAAGLQAAGVAKGDRVAIMLPNCPQAVAGYFGALLAGAIVVMTNPLYVERELVHQLRDSGAKAILTLDLLYPRLAAARGEDPERGPLPGLKHVIVATMQEALPFPKNVLFPLTKRGTKRAPIPYGSHGVIAYGRFLASPTSEPAPFSPNSGGDVALLQYTGGTTGLPKGVMLTHRNLIANALQTAAWCYRLGDGKERFLAALPLFHVFGLTVLMNQAVLRGGLLILLPRFEPTAVLKAIHKNRATVFPGAPTMYIAIMNAAKLHKYDLSSIEACVSGAAALPLDVQQRFEAITGGKLTEGYGMTESSPVTHANPLWGKRKTGSIGVPLPNTEARIVDPDTGEEQSIGAVGELLVRGPQVMLGYWNNTEATAAALKDGWLHTGDLAVMDEEGYFAIVGRRKDVIIAGGFNIYPREIEEVLHEHPAVREAAVIGINDPYRGESVKAFVVAVQDASVTEDELNRWCRERLAAFKVPHQYEFRAALPMSMIGKVLHRKLYEEEAAKSCTRPEDGASGQPPG